jgi:hypothetical protein
MKKIIKVEPRPTKINLKFKSVSKRVLTIVVNKRQGRPKVNTNLEAASIKASLIKCSRLMIMPSTTNKKIGAVILRAELREAIKPVDMW